MESPASQALWAWNGPQIFLFCRFQLVDSVFLLPHHSTNTALANISHFVPLIPRLAGFLLCYIAIKY